VSNGVPAQRVSGSKSVQELERQTNVALERLNAQIKNVSSGGVSAADMAALQAQINQLFALSGANVNNGGTGTSTPVPPSGSVMVTTDGITITGNGSSVPIALVEPILYSSIATSTTPYPVTATDYFIQASASAGADIIVNLPTSVGPDPNGRSRVLVIKKLDANPHNVVVTAAGADTIDGLATQTITLQYDSLRLWDGAAGAWSIW
jgi:hypothetical protein